MYFGYLPYKRMEVSNNMCGVGLPTKCILGTCLVISRFYRDTRIRRWWM